MNVFKSIGSFFSGIFFPKFKVFINQVFTQAVTIAMAEIQDIVFSVVEDISYENITNAQKREAAVKAIKAKLKESGKEASESVIRATIELSVLKLKQSVGEK